MQIITDIITLGCLFLLTVVSAVTINFLELEIHGELEQMVMKWKNDEQNGGGRMIYNVKLVDPDKDRTTPCPHCNDAWIYVSDGDMCSGYEAHGYRINCICGFAWKSVMWCETKQEARENWNEVVKNEMLLHRM